MNSSQKSTNAQSMVMTSEDLYPTILDFLSVEDQANMARTSQFTLASLNQIYQTKLTSQSMIEGSMDEKQLAEKAYDKSHLRFPLSAFVFQFADNYKVTPQRFIEKLRENKDKADATGDTPIITVCKKSAYDVELFKREFKAHDFNNPDFKLLTIMVTLGGHDTNYAMNGRRGLDYIINQFHPNKMLFSRQRQLMATFLISHPNTNNSTITQAFTGALELSTFPRKRIRGNLSLVDFLETKKIDFNPGMESKLPSTLDVLLRKVTPNSHDDFKLLEQHLVFSQALEKIIEYHAKDDIKNVIILVDILEKKLNFDVKDTTGYRIEDAVEQPILKVFLKAQRLLQSIKDDKTEYKSQLTFFAAPKQYGSKKAALNNLILAIKQNVLHYKELDLEHLENLHPILASKEMDGILEPFRQAPKAPKLRSRRLM